jgi:hypothetical protein
MEKVENLWSAIEPVVDVDSPKYILSQQAKYLSDMTKNYLVGEVRTDTYNDRLQFYLIIKAPTLKYQFTLLSVEHDLRGYPLELYDSLKNERIKVSNEQEFKENLGKILKSSSTNRALRTLLANNFNRND